MTSTVAAAFADQGLTVVEDQPQGGSGTPPAGTPPGGTPPGGTSFIKDGKFDEADFFKTTFGEESPFKTLDELKKVPETLKEYNAFKTRIPELEAQVKEKRNPFHNETIAKLNILAKETGLSDLSVLSRMLNTDIAKADAKTLLVMSKILANPELSTKQNIVERMIDKQYNFAAIDADTTLGDSEKESEKELLQAEMDIAANETRKKFSELIGKAVIQKPEEAEAVERAELEQARVGWTPIVAEIQKSMTKIQIPAGPFTVDFEVPAKSMEAIVKNAIDFASKSFKGEITKANATQLINYCSTLIKVANEAAINHEVMKKGRALSEQEWIKQAHNPSDFNKDTPPGGGSGSASVQDQVYNFFNNR